MAKDEEEGLIERGKRYLKERAAKRGKELREKAEKSAKAEPAETPTAPAPRGPVMGPGGYGGRGGAEAQKRQIEQEERGEDLTTTGVSFKSSNQGQTGRQTATERRKRDNRLKSTMI